jgi:hypothetical protein
MSLFSELVAPLVILGLVESFKIEYVELLRIKMTV